MGSGVPQWPAANESREKSHSRCHFFLRNTGITLRRTAEAPTETLDQRSAPEPVGQTLAHPGAHERVSRVAGEDGCRSVHSQRADLVAVRRSSEVAAGND